MSDNPVIYLSESKMSDNPIMLEGEILNNLESSGIPSNMATVFARLLYNVYFTLSCDIAELRDVQQLQSY